MGMLNEAISEYRAALALNPAYAKAHYNLSMAYDAQGNREKAFFHRKRAEELGMRVPARK